MSACVRGKFKGKEAAGFFSAYSREKGRELTDYVDLDGMVDLALAIEGDARVIALILLEDAAEVQGAVGLLHVLGKVPGAILVPFESRRSRAALSLTRDLRTRVRAPPTG